MKHIFTVRFVTHNMECTKYLLLLLITVCHQNSVKGEWITNEKLIWKQRDHCFIFDSCTRRVVLAVYLQPAAE